MKISALSKSTYFYTLNKVNLDDKNQSIIDEISDVFKSNKSRYGYRRVTLELKNRGLTVNHKKVKRIMSSLNLFGIKVKAKYKSYKGEIGKTAPNIFNRDFSCTHPNEKWSTDVTEFHIVTGKLYLSPIMDLYTKEIVSFDVSISPNFRQINDMLNRAFEKYPETKGIIMNSDQGWQYQMFEYREALKVHGIIQSMSRKGNCLDNSPMENFFGVMKREMFYGHEWEFKSLNQLKEEIVDYINYYNTQRISGKLKGLSPIKFRHQSLSPL